LVRQQMADKKSYLIDNAFMTQLTYRFSNDMGKLLENLIAIELRRRQPTLTFIKGVKECDFVVQKEDQRIPLQVTLEMTHPDTKTREISGLVSAAQFLNVRYGVIITLDTTAHWQIDDIQIEVIPAWHFLLDQSDA
jgi:predicted AAA+ superfamily ATPase